MNWKIEGNTLLWNGSMKAKLEKDGTLMFTTSYTTSHSPSILASMEDDKTTEG